MEQQLIDALEKAESPDDIDEVSKAMITARVTNVLMKVRELTTQYIECIEAMRKEHELELKLGGMAIVLNVTDDIASNQTCILGPKNKVLENIAQITENCNGK